MASERNERLRTALAAHRRAQEEYDRAQAALGHAETILAMTRHEVEQAIEAIKNEGAD